jgi:hypothetical protein
MGSGSISEFAFVGPGLSRMPTRRLLVDLIALQITQRFLVQLHRSGTAELTLDSLSLFLWADTR